MADKIILKKSSILGKRPTNENIDPGELALNTNYEDPGLFFEASNGEVVKVGPTSISYAKPLESPSRGETWYDLSKGNLNVGSIEEAKKVWRAVASPFLGGTENCVFVAPEFSYSTDRLDNNGQTLPFQTLNRAILEVSKKYINNVLAGFDKTVENNRYTIFLAPSLIAVNNERGESIDNFTVDFSSGDQEVTITDLVKFNSESGGLILPTGITIAGMDLKKCILSPSYVPSYRHPVDSPLNTSSNEGISSILKGSGNSYINTFTFSDKRAFSEVVSVSDSNSLSVFETRRPHSLKFNDLVRVDLNAEVDQSTGTFVSGYYYAIPISPFKTYLSSSLQGTETSGEYVSFSEMPTLPDSINSKMTFKLDLKSAHRLRAVTNASKEEIGIFYTKVQRAFSKFFGGRVVDGISLVGRGDYEIVGATSSPYPSNLDANTTKNSSFYAKDITLRSDYGMVWGDFDGDVVEGFKSITAYGCTAVSLQNDPSVYEIYTTLVNENGVSEQKWWNLTQAQYLSLPATDRPESLFDVSTESQLSLLNSTPINNIRYYYKNLSETVTGEERNIGIVDIDEDFRHFGFRVRNGAYAQLQSVYTIGTAIGVWALNGGLCNLTNSTSNFGSMSFKSEGFQGINSTGGANENCKGFVLEGVQRPLALTKSQAENPENKKVLSLGSKILNIYLDPEDPEVQIIELSADFSPGFLLPYSLAPGSALWVETEQCTYRGFFATDGGPTVVTGLDDPLRFASLRLRASDSTIPNDPTLLPLLGVPYIRRFKDPRPEFDRAYTLYLSNTNPNSIAPQVGFVLRLNQTSQQLGSNLIRPNVQFDPGISGGWGRVFTVDAVGTGSLASSPQFNYVLADTNQDLSYYVAVTVSDYSRPWVQGTNFKNPVGTYVTHKERNWYVAENNMWSSVYYGETPTFNGEFGPYSLAPYQPYSPFVDSSVTERQDIVSGAFQGTYGPDPYASLYPSEVYFRGATSPYPAYSTQDCFDGDDSSASLGICLSSTEDGPTTYTVTPTTLIQSEQLALLSTETGGPRRYRPAVIEFSVLSPTSIPNPRQKVSVLALRSGASYEYIRVIGLNGSIVRGIRLTPDNSSYTSSIPENGTSYTWPMQTQVIVCSTNSLPEANLYDPAWTNTKRSVLRFFEIMGYANDVMLPYLKPKYWGERLLSIESLNSILPVNGYAISTGKWPLEFNQPSSIIANTHTWTFSGYYNYSRGLPRFQSTDITRKLAADFQAYTLWSGKLTVTGINDKGEIVQFGPQRQALTATYFEPTSPTVNQGNQQLYEEQEYVEFPSQVSVFSADDISTQFNGTSLSFELRRSGLPIPQDQLSSESVIVTVGGVAQVPLEDYVIVNNSIQFSASPLEDLVANVRVITSADSSKTLKVFTLKFIEPFDGSRSSFTVDLSAIAPSDITGLLATEITPSNTFVFLGGVMQVPLSTTSPLSPFSYSIERPSPETIIFNFTGAPPANTSSDIRVFASGSYWSLRSIYPVKVYSLDTLVFDGASVSFPLTYNGQPVNPSSVTEDNLILSLGGVIQIPGVSYQISNSVITFIGSGDPPLAGTTVNLRVIGNSEFISCGNPSIYGPNFLSWGPGIVLSLANEAGLLSN